MNRQASAGLVQDARYAIRLLRREPGFTAVAILTMALGIGATTMLFSVAYGVLLKPLPWPHADRLVRVTETRAGRIGRVRGTVMNGTYLAWAEHPTTIDGLAGWMRRTQTMTIVNTARSSRAVVPDNAATIELSDWVRTTMIRPSARTVVVVRFI